MHTVYSYIDETDRPLNHYKIKKRVLVERISILTDVLQSLIEYVAKKEKVQLGVLIRSTPSGAKHLIYECPLEEKTTP